MHAGASADQPPYRVGLVALAGCQQGGVPGCTPRVDRHAGIGQRPAPRQDGVAAHAGVAGHWRCHAGILPTGGGPGIRPDNLERVFERFYTDRPEGSFGSNSGLGLSISKQIVDAHRGRIWAENRYGKAGEDGEKPVLGARFIVRIPAAADA